MRLHELEKIKAKGKKRLGRGIGSGLGKTAGRGTKGQKARGKIPVTFSGSLSLYRKLPRRKGAGNPKTNFKPKLINLSALNVFKAKTAVGLGELLQAKIISDKDKEVKILSRGEIEKALTIKLPISQSARRKIENAGGKCENV